MSTPLYKQSSGAIFSDVGDDVVALHIDKGQCYGMESIAAVIWHLLAEPIDLDRICDELLEEYEVDAERCRSDVAALLGQFRNEGLVETIASDRD